jgi:hypothetical protein
VLTPTSTENAEEELRKFGSTKVGMVPFYTGLVGEDVYVPGAWRSQGKAPADQDDIFSDVVEDGDSDDDDDDEGEWEAFEGFGGGDVERWEGAASVDVMFVNGERTRG